MSRRRTAQQALPKEHNGQKDNQHQPDDNGNDQEDLRALVALLLEARGLKLRSGAGSLQLVGLDALGNDAGLVEGLNLLLPNGLGLAGFQTHLDGAEAQDLPGLERRFTGDLLAVDKRAVGGIEIANDDLAAAQEDLGVMAGDGGFRDFEGVVGHTTDSGLLHLQLVTATG